VKEYPVKASRHACMHESIRGRKKTLTQGTCKIKRKKENP
jgi:hypothetical protein